MNIDEDLRQTWGKPLETLEVQAIMAYLGKDATEEWVMIHKPGGTWRDWHGVLRVFFG